MIEIKGKDIVWSYLGALLSMAANIVMIPFLVYYLDENLLGLWYVFCSIGAMTALFDFGFATTFARNIICMPENIFFYFQHSNYFINDMWNYVYTIYFNRC